jgi:hypothetical protein
MKPPTYIKVKTLDGVEVEVTHCDAGFPPGSVGGQGVNTTSVWIRPHGKDWIRATLRSAMAVCGEIKHTNLVDLESKLGVKNVVTKESSS